MIQTNKNHVGKLNNLPDLKLRHYRRKLQLLDKRCNDDVIADFVVVV